MPSTAAIEPDFVNSNHADLLGCLLLYQHRQDEAIGISWTSAKVRGLLWYYGKLQEAAMDQMLTAAYLNGVIQQGAAEIKRLVKEAETADDKHAIARQVITLQEQIEKANEQLKVLESEPSKSPEL